MEITNTPLYKESDFSHHEKRLDIYNALGKTNHYLNCYTKILEPQKTLLIKKGEKSLIGSCSINNGAYLECLAFNSTNRYYSARALLKQAKKSLLATYHKCNTVIIDLISKYTSQELKEFSFYQSHFKQKKNCKLQSNSIKKATSTPTSRLVQSIDSLKGRILKQRY